MKKIAYGFLSLTGLCAVLALTPVGAAAQQTIRNVTLGASSAVIGAVTQSGTWLVGGSAGAATAFLPVRLSDGSSFLTPGTDATHDSAAQTAGPQLVGECDDTSTDAVDEGDAGKLRVDCTTREVLAKVTATNLDVQSGGADLATASAQSTANSSLATIATSQGASTQHYRTSAGATEDEFEVKASAGVLTGGIVTNTAATVSYLKCSNLTAANTTPGTSAVFFAVAIPGATTGAGVTIPIPPGGLTFSTALTCYLVKGAADTDVAEVGANEVKVNLFYR